MPATEKLDVFGVPVLDLPSDLGDGPFLSAPSSSVANNPVMASSNELFRRTEPFEDNFMTNMPVLGRSSHIMIGRFHVSDTIKSRSFRRVYQTFAYQPSPDLEGTFEIRFSGAGIATYREAVQAAEGNFLPNNLEKVPGAFANAMESLDGMKELSQPTLPARATTYQIRLRMPGYEPGNSGQNKTVDPLCILATSEQGRRLLSQNAIEVFSFGNHIGERKVFPITYPVGRSIPVIFDIVNHVPGFSISVDLLVEVLINRTKQNAEKEAAETAVPAQPSPEQPVSRMVPVGQVSSARLNGVNGTIPVGMETNALDVISER